MNLQLLHTISKAHNRAVTACSFDPIDPSIIYTASADATCKQWNLQENTSKILITAEKGFSDLAVGLNRNEEKMIALASDDKLVYLLKCNIKTNHEDIHQANEQKGKLRQRSAKKDQIDEFKILKLEGHSHYVFCVKFNSIGNLLASGSFDQSIRIWETITGKCLKTISAHAEPVTSLDFTPDSTLLASGSYDGLIRIWDVDSGRCVKTLADDNIAPLGSLKFTPNGKFVLAAGLDGRIRLWCVLPSAVTNITSTNKEKAPPSGNQQIVKVYSGHLADKFCTPVKLFVDSREQPYVVSGSEDGKLFVWNTNTKSVMLQEECFPLHKQIEEGHDGGMAGCAIIGCDVSNDVVIVGCMEPDCTVKVYKIVQQ